MIRASSFRATFRRIVARSSVVLAALVATGGAARENAAGVIATYSSEDGKSTDTRRERFIAVAVPENRGPTSRVPAGPFRVGWTGTLTITTMGEFIFSFAGSGTAELEVDGAKVLAESGALGSAQSRKVRLHRGPHRIRVSYRSPGEGRAHFRLLWSGRDFRSEPVPAHLLGHAEQTTALRSADDFRRGRALAADHGCFSCHAVESNAATSELIRESQSSAPTLTAAGERLRAAWLEAWIADPHAIRPGTRMPRVSLASPNDAADIAAFLGANGTPPPKPEWTDAAVDAGRKLFLDLQCLACHTLNDAADGLDRDRVSLRDVAAKWHPAALVRYLQDPARNNPSARMPDFGLSDEQANALAAFLHSRASAPVSQPSDGDVARGRAAYAANGCMLCHGSIGPAAASLEAGKRPMSNWSRGCVADHSEDRGRAPDFRFSPDDRRALRMWGTTSTTARFSETPSEYANRKITAFRCGACHERDGLGPALLSFADEAEALRELSPEASEPAAGESAASEITHAPSLTWAGEKLKPDWLAQQIGGEHPLVARPWLKARMPVFHVDAKRIAAGLAEQHGVVLLAESSPTESEAEAIALGKRLVGPEGLSCGTCHAIGEQPAAAPFGAPGVNLALSYERLQREFLHRWMDNPPRIDPTTKMPKFTDSSGRLAHPEFPQEPGAIWDALYAYLRALSTSATRSNPSAR